MTIQANIGRNEALNKNEYLLIKISWGYSFFVLISKEKDRNNSMLLHISRYTPSLRLFSLRPHHFYTSKVQQEIVKSHDKGQQPLLWRNSPAKQAENHQYQEHTSNKNKINMGIRYKKQIHNQNTFLIFFSNKIIDGLESVSFIH